MTNWYKIFWYFTVADNLKTVTATLSILFGVVFVALCISRAIRIDSDGGSFFKDATKPFKTFFFSVFFLGLFNLFAWTLLPTKKDALIIIVGGSVGNFVTSDSSSAKIPGDLTKLLHTYMQNEINDLDSDTKKQLGLQSPKDRLIDKAKDLTKDEIIKLLKSDTSVQVKQ